MKFQLRIALTLASFIISYKTQAVPLNSNTFGLQATDSVVLKNEDVSLQDALHKFRRADNDDKVCKFDGKWYDKRDIRYSDGEKCKCKKNGNWKCEKEMCEYDDSEYAFGEWVECSGKDCKEFKKCKCGSQGELIECEKPDDNDHHDKDVCIYKKGYYSEGDSIYCTGADCKYWSECSCKDGKKYGCKCYDESCEEMSKRCFYKGERYLNNAIIFCEGDDCKEWSKAKCSNKVITNRECHDENCREDHSNNHNDDGDRNGNHDHHHDNEHNNHDNNHHSDNNEHDHSSSVCKELDPTGNYYYCGHKESKKCEEKYDGNYKWHTRCCEDSDKCGDWASIKCNTSKCCDKS